MQGKVTLEDHFATEATLGDSQPFGTHVWGELRHRLLDFQEQRLRLMDESGVEIMIASLNAPAIQAIPDARRAAEIARQANDVLAGEVAKRPDRFVGVAALPMQDPEMATRELQRCTKDLASGARWSTATPMSKASRCTTTCRSTGRSGARSKDSTSRSTCIRGRPCRASRRSTRGTPGCSGRLGALPPKPRYMPCG